MKKIIIISCLAFAVHFAYGQKSGNFPYTRYGLGELVDQNVVAVRGMGGISNAFVDPYHSNFSNPASLSYLVGTSYEVGLFAKRSSITDGDQSSVSYNGTIDYISIAFPLHNSLNDAYENVKRDYRFGMGFKLSKFSNVAYDITSTDTDPDFGQFTRNYNGNGGSYLFQWSNSVLHKNFSLGLSLGYLFGKESYNKSITFDSLDYAFNNIFYNNNRISGFHYNVGALYSIVLNKSQIEDKKQAYEKKLTFGLRSKTATGFSSSNERVGLNIQPFGTSSTTVDTVYNDTIKGKGQLPLEFGFGLYFNNGEKSSYGLDVNFANWSNYFNDGNGDAAGSLGNAYSVALGGSFRPDFKSYTHFWKRVSYKYGLYYKRDPRIVKEKSINDYGVTLGTGLPFVYQRKVAHVNLGLELGSRGKGTAISENYFKVNLGFTFNDDEWFIKRKYN